MTSPRVATFSSVTGKKYDSMMGRCYREGDGSYENYGGRGIRVCAAWIRDINSFRTWFAEQLQAQGVTAEELVANPRNFQLDRINGNGHYTPDNCRVVTAQTNNRNRPGVKRLFVSAEGEEIAA